jgi:hypothetical protein
MALRVIRILRNDQAFNKFVLCEMLKQKIKAHFLQEQIEKLEEEKAQIQIEQQELENR